MAHRRRFARSVWTEQSGDSGLRADGEAEIVYGPEPVILNGKVANFEHQGQCRQDRSGAQLDFRRGRRYGRRGGKLRSSSQSTFFAQILEPSDQVRPGKHRLLAMIQRSLFIKA